jgi:GNAT superfamily N-acetyltransferase
MDGVELRALALEDMDAAALVHRASFDERLPWLAGLHTPDEDRRFFRERVFADCSVWGAFAPPGLAGFIAFRPGWIDQLYLLPAEQRRGIGAALLAIAKARNRTLSLWTFQRNAGARRFYERNGFVSVEETDGSGNEEREPDVRYVWQAGGPTPL